MNRQKMILAILLVVLAGSLVYSFVRTPRQRTVSKLTYTAQTPVPVKKPAVKRPAGASPAPTAPAPVKMDDRKLHLEQLDNVPQRFAGFRRNIFQPIFREEQQSAPRPLPAPPVRTLPKPPPPPPIPVPVAPPAPPQPPPYVREMARFTFLGFLKKDNRKTVFLSNNNEIYLVKKGDRVLGKYEVSNITDEALTITVQPDGGEIVIPLVENKPLTAPRR